MSTVIQNSQAPATHSAPVSPQTHHSQSATWKGFHVQSMPKGAVNVSDMSEEASLSMARFGADKSIKKKQEEDKKVKKSDSSSELMPGMSQYEAEIFVRALSQQQNKNAAASLELVKKFFRDPSLQDAALRFATAHIPENDAQHAELQKALEALHKESGSQIRAGYNIAPIEHKDLSPQQARDCYRFHILNYSSYENTFKNLLEEYDADKLPNTVDFLRKALGADIQSLEPSCAAAELHEVAEGLYVVQNLANLYTQADKLCTSSAERFSSKEPQAKEVMQGILHVKDNYSLTEPSLRQAMPFLNSKNPTRDAVFVRGLREITRNLPTKLYASEEQRQKVLSTLQQNLDKAIDREEALEE